MTDLTVQEFRHTKPSTLWTPEYATQVQGLELELGRTICGAHSKSFKADGERRGPCTRHPSVGRNRCYLHGGTAPRGVNSPHFRNRGYSKDIPKRLAQNMERAMQDPDLSSLKSELALMDARLGDLMAKLPENHSIDTWRSVRSHINNANAALDDGQDPEDVRAFLDHALTDLDVIRSEDKVWKQIYDVVAERRRLSVEERKREVELDGTVTAAQFDLVTGAMGNAVNEEVGGCEFLTEAQAEELITRIGARFAETLRYPILEKNTDPDTPILEVTNGRHGGIDMDV